MPQFPELPVKEYAQVYKEDTDKPLPLKLDQNLRYAYFSTIATGGKSIIQSCKDLHLGRFICYKALKPEFADDPIEQQRLLREARVSAMLQHPNTIPTYELGRNKSGHYYFTMKLVHGYTLREILDYIAKGGNVEPLFMGKIAIRHIPIVNELRWRGVLVPPPLAPRYMNQEESLMRLERLRKGAAVIDLLEDS